jgi:transcriptional regulator with XRE-family HTH domain
MAHALASAGMTKTRDPQGELFRRNLIAFRSEAGLSQTNLADLSGIGIDSIRKYEAGTNSLSATAIATLAKVLGRSPGDFYAEHPPKRGEGQAPPVYFLRTLPGAEIDEEVDREIRKQLDLANERMMKKRKSRRAP